MFDVSFIELLVIGVVALLVLGPERLPAAARTVGSFMRKARQSWNGVRSEFEREFAADEFRRSIQKTRDELRAAIDPTAAPPSPLAMTRDRPSPEVAAYDDATAGDDAPPEVPARGPATAPHD